MSLVTPALIPALVCLRILAWRRLSLRTITAVIRLGCLESCRCHGIAVATGFDILTTIDIFVADKDLAGMIPQKDHRDQKHENSIKDEQVCLAPHQHAVLSHAILDHAEEGTDEDQYAGEVEDVDELQPGRRDGEASGCRLAFDA